MKKNILSFILLLFLAACNSNKKNSIKEVPDEVKKAIAESNTVYWQAFAKGDSSLFIERYAADACIMPPNTSAMCGITAAPAFYNVAYHQMGIRNGKFITTEIFPGNEEYVTENGLFELRDSTNKLINNGKYLVLWKKTNKGWQMFRDCFSSNNPLPNTK